MEKRKLNMQFAKGGSGSRTTRLTLPVSFIDKLGVTADNREVNVIYVNGKIIITKEENKMTKDDLYYEYKGWRNQMEEFLEDGTIDSIGGSVDCGEGAVREDFTAWAHLDEEIRFEEMFELEKRYNNEFNKETW